MVRLRSVRDAKAPGRLPPVILMGGQGGGALSVARSLGRAGVDVYLLGEPGAPYTERYSRFVRYVSPPKDRTVQDSWAEFLLERGSDGLRGAVLLACSDLGIELILQHRAELAERFILDISDVEAQACALNKMCSYRKATEAGIPVPRFWQVDTVDDLLSCRDDLLFPLLLKPVYSHKFSAALGTKFLRAEDFGGLCEAFERVLAHDQEVVLLEMIPGPDDLLCSYFTYVDESGTPLFDYTKRVLRRYPENKGLGCYHVTEWLPDVAELGRRYLTHLGIRGLGNVEFKRDARDGALKVIECNARFTAANGLVTASGYDLGRFVYNRLVGRSQAPLAGQPYRSGLHLWYPENDTKAFLELRAAGRLTFTAWARSLMHRQVFPYFSWDDPAPSAAAAARIAGRAVRKGVRRISA